MTFREIFRFELAYQARRVSTWLYFAVLAVFAVLVVRGTLIDGARGGAFLLNSPHVITVVTVFGSLIWLLLAAALVGDAAARDVQTRMSPLIYTAPVSKAGYLGGRFLAAFVLNAVILLALSVGVLIAVRLPGVEPELLGPFRPAAYLAAYFFIALPNAFVATSIQFSWAVLDRRAMASYLAGLLIFFTGFFVSATVAQLFGEWELAKLIDPIGVMGIVRFLEVWTPTEKNTRLIGLEGSFLANRIIWLGIASSTLAFTYARFRFSHADASSWWSRFRRRRRARARPAMPAIEARIATSRISIPQIRRTFGLWTHLRQTLAIARTSFRTIARSRGGLTLVVVTAMPLVAIFGSLTSVFGVPLLPTTGRVLTLLTSPLTDLRTPWILIPLLIVFYAGELIWREREAGISEIADAAPVPEWVLFLGKFLGLGLVIATWMAMLVAAGRLIQLDMGSRVGYPANEIGLFVRVLFGLQLTEYLLFAVLALVVHVVVNQKYLGHLVALLAYGFIGGASGLGIEHKLLVYGSAPQWIYTDMRGFGRSLEPWLWFKTYWIAWAVLLAVAATLLWARGTEQGLGARLRQARRRFANPMRVVTGAAVALILTVGGVIVYNTDVLNARPSVSQRVARSAEYERRYGRYEGIPQPQLTRVTLRVEIYPARRAAAIRGTYSLVNRSTAAIGAIHLATMPGVETGAVTFDRSAALTVADEDLGYRIYTLEKALQPGDALRLNFEVQYEARGFSSNTDDAFVFANGTYVTNRDWLPAIGYQRNRELNQANARKTHGLPPRPAMPTLDDVGAQGGWDRIAFDAVVGTDADQIAVAPGALRGTWTEGARRYFHFTTSAPISNVYSFFSARYAVHDARWNDVAIRFYYHPAHATNLDRMVRSVHASLDYFTKQFGPYPYTHITFVERGGRGQALNGEASAIDYGETFSFFRPLDGPYGVDLVFYAIAHEVAHQWWGHQVAPAPVEGAAVIGEGLAVYSGMQVLEKTYGHEHLERYVNQVLRAAYETPRSRAAAPLLRADNGFLGYRKGPLALYALSRYVGVEQVNGALRRLVETHGTGAQPLPTMLDLYRELRAVTPDSRRDLLHDLFEANTYWELDTEGATAAQTDAGTWQVTLDVRARKLVVDGAGVETDVPMDDWIEVGVFEDNASAEPLHLAQHRIRSGAQTITVTVPRKPARAGIDPLHLLIDLEPDDNVETVKAKS